MKENSSKSPGSDGEIKNDDDKQQGEEGILQMVSLNFATKLFFLGSWLLGKQQ